MKQLVKKCPECEVELTEYEGQFVCEICGYIHGETPEDRYARDKAHREKHLKYR